MDLTGPPSDPPTRLDSVLAQIRALFEKLSIRQEDFAMRLQKVESGKAELDALRKVQDEMRSYVDAANKTQSEGMEKIVNLHVAGTKSDIERRVADMLKAQLNEWISEKLQPLVSEIIEQREKLREEQAKARREKYRSWIILATSGILFLGTMAQLFFSKDQSNRDVNTFNRAIERMNDIVTQ